MNIPELLETKLAIGILSGIGGIVVSLVTQWFLNKRAVFRYDVDHNRIGLSSDDDIYGSVRVTWNGTELNHLFLSTVRIANDSMKDFESVTVRIFSSDTQLLTEFTSIEGTTRNLEYTEDFASKIKVNLGSEPTNTQFSLFRSQRDYLVPTFNRGQILRFEFLNAPTSDAHSIWVDILHKGVVCKFKKPVNQIFGVSQPRAVFVGTIICLVAVSVIAGTVENVSIAAFSSFFFGWLVLIPGALTILAARKLRDVLAG